MFEAEREYMKEPSILPKTTSKDYAQPNSSLLIDGALASDRDMS